MLYKVILSALALAGWGSAVTDSRLTAAIVTTDRITSAVSSTPDGRLFLYFSTYLNNSTGPSMAEKVANGSYVPYPDEEWNSWNSSDSSLDPATHFVGIAAQRIGPDGALWVLDSSTGDFPPKLVSFNLTTNTVAKTILITNITLSSTHWDDFRFNGNMVYLTDINDSALGLLDLETGAGTRVLEGHLSTVAYFPASAEGNALWLSDGTPHFANADQLEVSPDGTYLYYQAQPGALWRVATALLDAAVYNATAAAALVNETEPYAPTVSTGGTAIDAAGTVYASDTTNNAILRVLANGTTEVFIQDDRLQWADAMWVDSQDRLWMPCNQLFRGARFGTGVATYEPPFYVFTVDIGVGPSPIDHA